MDDFEEENSENNPSNRKPKNRKVGGGEVRRWGVGKVGM